MTYIKNLGVVLSVIAAIIGIGWTTLGFPTIATGQDIQKLELRQLQNYGIPLTEDRVDRLTIRKAMMEKAGLAGTAEYQAVARQLDRAQTALQNGRARTLKLTQ